MSQKLPKNRSVARVLTAVSCVAISLPGCAQVSYGAAASSLGWDGYETYHGVVQNGGQEGNKLLGEHPNGPEVVGYFLLSETLLLGANYALRNHPVMATILNTTTLILETDAILTWHPELGLGRNTW